jgi:hypothetical protein
MPLPKRLRQDLKELSPRELRELQGWLTQLLHQQERIEGRLPGKQGAAKRRYTYRREYVKCGKEGCTCAEGKGHGPYWYAYWKEKGKLKKKYLGSTKAGGG